VRTSENTSSDRPPVPETLDEVLSPRWLTAALGTRFPGIVVSEVTPGPVVSRMSTNARFRIRCAGGLPDGLSPDLCAKGYFGDIGRSARAAGMSEAAFYRELAATTGVRTLPSVYADVDHTTHNNVVLTEDVVAQGATFLDPLSRYTPDQAAESLEELAKLHAATWGSPVCERATWLAPRFSMLVAIRGVKEIRGNFDGPIGAGVPEAVRDPQRLFDAYSRVAADAMTASPWAVIHGDAHVGNLFLDREGRPSFVDWQLAQRGPWYLDVAYHLASALTVEDRRRAEDDLVRHYLDRLAAGGVESPTQDEVRRGLRRGLLHGFYLWGITLKVDPPITSALLERLGTAVDDHDALHELP
jgi:thiamine kinase-like enzyme